MVVVRSIGTAVAAIVFSRLTFVSGQIMFVPASALGWLRRRVRPSGRTAQTGQS
jgi:hypothetical protein